VGGNPKRFEGHPKIEIEIEIEKNLTLKCNIKDPRVSSRECPEADNGPTIKKLRIRYEM
jgi:hypothetical protein